MSDSSMKSESTSNIKRESKIKRKIKSWPLAAFDFGSLGNPQSSKNQ